MARTFEGLRLALVDLTRALQAARPIGGGAPAPAPGATLTAGVTPAGAPFAALSTSLTGLTGAAAGTAASLLGIVKVAGSFVEALSPAAMEAMSMAFRDLQAVIGVALLPVITAATDAFRQIADVLLPVMRDLQPIMARLANIIVSVLVPVISLAAQLFGALLPIIDALLPVIEFMAAMLRVFVAVLSAVISAIVRAVSTMFGADLADMVGNFKKALDGMIRAIVLLVGYLFIFIGAIDLARDFARKLAGERTGAATGLAAIQDVQMKGLAEVVKGLNLAAAKATEVGAPGKEEDPLKQAAAALNKLLDSPAATEATLKKVITEAVSDAVYGGIKGVTYSAGRTLGSAARRIADPLGFLDPREELTGAEGG
jgi:hypothetical protein